MYLYHRKMEVFFPKFKLDQKYKMHELLKQMGVRKIFSPWADLSNLAVTERSLKVSKVSQGLSGGVQENRCFSIPLNVNKKVSCRKVKVTQLCLTLCDPMDYTVHGILQARILDWVAFPFSTESSQPRDGTQVSRIVGGFFTS